MITSNGQCHLELINVKRTEVVFMATSDLLSSHQQKMKTTDSLLGLISVVY